MRNRHQDSPPSTYNLLELKRSITFLSLLMCALYMASPQTQLTTQAQNAPQCVKPTKMQFAVVGDYGICTENQVHCEAEAAVARAVDAANPPFVVAVGDLNYNDGQGGDHIRNNNLRAFPGIAQPPQPPDPSSGVPLYERFINEGRFFIALGNHDYHQSGANPATTFFGQPGSNDPRRFGPVELWVIDSNEIALSGPDRDKGSTPPVPSLNSQLPQLAQQIRDSPACWKVVYMHHSSTSQGSIADKGAPVKEGHIVDPTMRTFMDNLILQSQDKIDVVLFGHTHAFEYTKINEADNTHFFLAGAGGARLNEMGPPFMSVRKSSIKEYGFLLIDVGDGSPATLSVNYHQVKETGVGSPPQPWYEDWSTSVIPIMSTTKTCQQGNVICTRQGMCQSHTYLPPTPLSGSYRPCTPVSPDGDGCTTELTLLTSERFACPTPVPVPGEPRVEPLIEAYIQAPICCNQPAQAQCEDYGCPVIADAFDCQGNLILSTCLRITWAYYVAWGETGCVFDRFNTPCKWVLRINKPGLKLKCPAIVQYLCCLDCRNSFVGGPQ